MIPNLDHKARLVIMSAYLYYRHDSPILSDSEYDSHISDIVDFFDFLDPIRQFQFESPDALNATGYHIKITRAALHGAHSWYFAKKSKFLDRLDLEWNWDFTHKVSWISAG